MYSLLRPLLFRLDPERAHAFTLQLIRLAGALSPIGALVRKVYELPERPVEVFGLRFKNPLGLAAGYDKDGIGWRGLACLGFGHIELGTVTPYPQSGNPKPRIFRIPEQGALINRLGFPGHGSGYLVQKLQGSRPADLVLGVNLGKNADTALDRAVDDYLQLLRVFAPLVDYLAINVSSPNTIGLRRLQARDALMDLLSALASERGSLADKLERHVPMLVKLSPDLADVELDDALDVLLETGMDGVIATNTTTRRDGLPAGGKHRELEGGLSGVPLHELSTRMIATIYRRVAGKLPIIGVGGIMSARDAQEKLDAGAVLLQVYTGLVYRGPGLVREIVKGISPAPSY